ncbi:MAG: hypothetical protein Q4E24_03490 [bacterium]|nr:hypothetical protein [bacterium]
MTKKIEIYIPVYKAHVLCHSELLDSLGDFTKFILWSIGHKKTISQINQVVKLGDEIIKDEIKDLQRYGILDKNDYSHLTELGLEYFSLIECFENLKNNGIRCIIELFKGQVVPDKNIAFYDKSNLPENALVLEQRVSEIFMLNNNYENSFDVAKRELTQSGLLSSKYIDKIYTSMKIDKKENIYAKYIIYSYEGDMYAEHVDLHIGIPMGIYTYKKYYTCLDQYRTVLFTLKKLRDYDIQMLSEKALDIVDAYSEECNESKFIVHMDLYSKTPVSNADKIILRPKNAFDYVLPSEKIRISFENVKDMRFEEEAYNSLYAFGIANCSGDFEKTEESVNT